MTGTAIFLGGLKNGRGTTFAETVCRTASTVISMLSVVPTAECSRPTQASAIIFFSVVDHVFDLALPTCRPPPSPRTPAPPPLLPPHAPTPTFPLHPPTS